MDEEFDFNICLFADVSVSAEVVVRAKSFEEAKQKIMNPENSYITNADYKMDLSTLRKISMGLLSKK